MTPRERVIADQAVLQLLGIEVDQARIGSVKPLKRDETSYLSLMVRESMLNGKDVCHGGILFAFADTVAAYALGDAGVQPVTLDANITYLRPARAGDRIDARVHVLKTGRRNGTCAVSLINAAKQPLAEFRATCANIEDL